MKYCPKCGYETDDEEILYCAEDGQLLVEKKQRKTKKTETVISKKASKKPEESKESKKSIEPDKSKESTIKTTTQEQTSQTEESTLDLSKTNKTDFKSIILSVLMILFIILCFIFNNQAVKLKDQLKHTNDIFNQYYDYCRESPKIQIKVNELYNADDYGNNIGNPPFYSNSMQYLCCNYSVVLNPNYNFGEDDYLEIRIMNLTSDYLYDQFYQTLDKDIFYVDAYFHSDCWYIVQWIYNDKVIYEKSFFIN
ncbi:MAG: hypothetical protein J5726_01440 [Treponema sp.]|nr:hypothetical protein [Treponema sp.]